MKCPYCGSEFTGDFKHCPNCKQPLSRAKYEEADSSFETPSYEHETHTHGQRWLIALATLVCCIALCFGIYKVVFWASNYRIHRLYTRGEYTPTVNEVMLDDGRAGHSIVFYGKDGDQIFLPELQKSLSISGGTARISIADADWFTADVNEIESANVCLSPLLIDEKGMRTQLPGINMEIVVPQSPLEVISPAGDVSVVTSRYALEFQVVPGSTVQVNGEDVTDIVDRNGLLSQNVNVYPVGDNVYTIVVKTPQHHETRREVVIHRQIFDIEVEVDSGVSITSQTDTTTIRGTIENGATINVETGYIPESLIINPETGEFSFIAKLSEFGSNTIRFRVSKQDRNDAVINLSVEYTPTVDKYTSTAWAMNYDELRRLYEQWNGQVFKCSGTVVDIYDSNGAHYFVMDVSNALEQQLVILENISSTTEPAIGETCTAYADVTGRSMYNDQYYPTLAARYIYTN